MARVDVVMPQMGESIAEGTLSKWLKKVGDQVKRDEPMFEISTDKVDAEIPAPSTGVLAEILVTEGQTVAGADRGRAPRDGREAAAVAAPAAAAPAPTRRARKRRRGAGGPRPQRICAAAAAAPAIRRRPTRAVARQRRQLARGSPAHQVVAARSPHGRRARRRDQRAAGHGHRRPRHEEGPARLPRVGRDGAAASRRRAGRAGAVGHGPLPEPWPGDVVEPMSKMRALIAEHMVVSRHTSAHVNSFFEVDFTRIARIRAKHRAEFEKTTGEKLTYHAVHHQGGRRRAQGASRCSTPSVRGNEIIYRKQINLGIAVALDWGLIVPVIKNADNLSLTGLTRIPQRSRESRAQQAARSARSAGRHVHDHEPGRVRLADRHADHQPAAGRRSSASARSRSAPKVITGADGEDTIAIRTCAYLSLSFDHRIVDGADADKFMAFVKKTLETFPETVL